MSSTPATDVPQLDDDDEDDIGGDCQTIPGSRVDFEKLLFLLRMKFDAGSYDVHVSWQRD